jgi:hypothetical protein
LAPKKCKGTPLKVFSGKEATLNRIILLILRSSKQPLTRYDVYLRVHGMKGSRHKDSKTVYRRMDALFSEKWINAIGTRQAKVRGESILYALAQKGETALRLDQRKIEDFLETANKDQLIRLIDLLEEDR